MSESAGAFRYLIVRTTRNRLVRQATRLKNPRYAVGLVLGVAYFVLVLGRAGVRSSDQPQMPSLSGAAPVAQLVLSILLAASAMAWWIFGKVNSALAFQPAEVQFLFPAPVTRRRLIGYKVVRSQLVILLNAVIWTLLSRRFGSTTPIPVRFMAVWALFSVFNLHRLALALLLLKPATGLRRLAGYAIKGLGVLAAVLLTIAVVPPLLHASSLGLVDALNGLKAALESAPASWVLGPLQVVLAPAFAPTAGAALQALAIVVAIVVIHLGIVFLVNVPFEEAAANASTKLAARRTAARSMMAGNAAVVKPKKTTWRWLPLAPTGQPAVAIAWKNTMALLRTGMLMRTVVPLVIIVGMSTFGGGRSGSRGGASAAGTFAFALMLLIIGPRTVRNDLRQDLVNLPLLKSYPLSGRTMVAAQLLSPTIVIVAVVCLLLAASWITVPPGTIPALNTPGMIGLVILIPVAVTALTALNVGLQNGVALLFPSWIRLGADSGGIEAMGQNLLSMIYTMLALIVALILPGGIGTIMVFMSKAAFGFNAYTAADIGIGVGVLVLGIELVGMLAWFGREFEKTEPQALA